MTIYLTPSLQQLAPMPARHLFNVFLKVVNVLVVPLRVLRFGRVV